MHNAIYDGYGSRQARKKVQRIAIKNANDVAYLHGDHLRSTSVTSGAISSAQTYYAFGAVRTTSGTLPTDYTFTGQKIDGSDGLMYYQARYYDVAIGRFIQPDSIIEDWYNPQYLNRYAYVRNNPVRYTDPTGNRVCEDADCHKTYTTSQVNKIVQQVQTQTPATTKDDQVNHETSARQSDGDLANALYNTSRTLDQWALAFDSVGEGFSLGGALFSGATCSETGVGILACAGVGYVGGNTLAQATVNRWGNVLSVFSTGLTGLGDILTGETNLNGGTLTFGPQTIASAKTTAVGFVPDTTVDLIAASVQFRVNDMGAISPYDLPHPLDLLTQQDPWVFPLTLPK